MSSIRERTILSVVDLPKKLTSRRNLHAHFSKYGEVMNISVKKELKSAMVQFATHFHAQSAKTQGTMYEDKPLNIFWAGSSLPDPRAREKQDYDTTVNEPLWLDDDKECFGVESVQQKKDIKEVPKDILKKKNVPAIKRRLSMGTGANEERSTIKPMKKTSPKVTRVSKNPISSKRALSTIVKYKLGRKEDEMVTKKKKSSSSKEQLFKPAILMERVDIKHKLTVLDERDKLIRSKTVQDSNIKTAVAIKGTCPDMCPERERILRQCGHAVATYEMLPGSNEMDEKRAVKEYIRSSADQEVPLPHDLRPEPVLSLTMDYLITNIISKVDDPHENKAVWYSFCWNRLRSIRKDIILQQLCDMETVKIVEQCARFHICCYDHMWGAEVSGFDDKINTKNLINCLQTLRHMYEDLEKHNVVCPNEAEFYSYLILLKLESGDVMWEYQQYSLGIQLSSHIQFAIQAYMAFKNNMYSRYFSLVKKAPYLTACLMQRYFNQVRTQALKTMLRAYCLPGKNVGLSSSFIVSSLKFDSQKNAVKFCEKEEVDLKVDMNHNEDDVYVITSSFLIKNKRLPIANAVVGENNPIPVYFPHEVHSSFDEFGNLKDDSFSPVSEEDNMTFSEEDIKEEQFEESPEEIKNNQQPDFKFSLSTTVVKDKFFSDSFPSDQSITQNDKPIRNILPFFDNSARFVGSSDIISSQGNKAEKCQDFEDNVFKVQAREAEKINKFPILSPFDSPKINVSSPSLIEKSKPKLETSFITTSTQNNSLNLTHSPLFSTVENSSSNNTTSSSPQFMLPRNELFSFMNVQNPNKFTTVSHIKNDDNIKFNKLIEDNSRQGIEQKDVFVKKEREELQLKLEKQREEEASRKLLHEAFIRAEEERLILEEQKRIEAEKLKKQLEEKIMYQNLKKDLSRRLKALNAKKYARQWKKKVEKLKKTRADFPMLVSLSVNDHLSLWGKVSHFPSNNLFQRAKEQRNLSKVVFQLMHCGITDTCKYLSSDLAETIAHNAAKSMEGGRIKPVFWKLVISVPWENKQSSELSVFNKLMRRWCHQSFYAQSNSGLGSVEHVMTSLEIPVNLSVLLSDNFTSNHELQAMDALIFLVLNESESEKTCLQRLRSLVTGQVKNGSFSIAVMNVGGVKFERVLRMELEELQEQNFIAHWAINTWSSPKSITDSLNMLAEHIEVTPQICASRLEILVKQVSEEFFDALSSSRHSSNGLMEAVKNPSNVINLYNTCLTKLEDLLMSSKLEKFFNFAEEFKVQVPLNESGGPELMCGRKCDAGYKNTIMQTFKRLKLPELNKWPPKSPNRLVKVLKSYCQLVSDVNIFPQIVRMLDLPDDGELTTHLEQVQWLNVVEVWAQSCLIHVFSKEKGKQAFVMYNKTLVNSMIRRQWWLKHPMVVKFEKCLS